MPDTTLIINHADGGSETYTINRDKFEGLRTMETIPEVISISGMSEGNGDYKRTEEFNQAYGWTNEVSGADTYVLIKQTTWLIFNLTTQLVVASTVDDVEYPWEVTTWVGDTPTLDASERFLEVDRRPSPDLRSLLIDADTITIDRSAGQPVRTLTIDGVAVEIDRSDEVAFFGLLDEVTGAAAAYSLRRLSSAYTGSAVQIRRSSDDVEVNVQFDSNDKVSASSPITNVTESPDSGDTTATTLGGFLTEDIVTRTSDFSSSADGFISFSSDTITFNEDGIGGLDDNLSSTAGNTGSQVFGLNGAVSAGFEYKISVRYFIPQSNGGSYSEVSIWDGASIKIATDSSPATGSWVTLEGTATYTSPQIRIQFTGTSVAGDKVYIREFSVSRTKQDAAVVTWYDQSGNANHATQDVAGSQPKIAEAGALIAEGLDFDGVGNYLETTNGYIVELSQNPASVFAVATPGPSNTGKYLLTEGDSLTPYSSQFILNGSAAEAGLWVNTTLIGNPMTPSVQSLTGFIYNETTFQPYLNGAVNGTATAATVNTETSLESYIGSSADLRTDGFYKGRIAELITYKSDQSANRTGIESNIADEYGITLP